MIKKNILKIVVASLIIGFVAASCGANRHNRQCLCPIRKPM
jgi:hypothetical protein